VGTLRKMKRGNQKILMKGTGVSRSEVVVGKRRVMPENSMHDMKWERISNETEKVELLSWIEGCWEVKRAVCAEFQMSS
jgi:hypothetical protein